MIHSIKYIQSVEVNCPFNYAKRELVWTTKEVFSAADFVPSFQIKANHLPSRAAELFCFGLLFVPKKIGRQHRSKCNFFGLALAHRAHRAVVCVR